MEWWRSPINAAVALVGITVGLLALIGCAGTVPVAEDPTPTTPATVKAATKEAKETKAPKNPRPKVFVQALGSNVGEVMKAAQKVTVKGSTAAVYLQHQANLLEAELDGGTAIIGPDPVNRKGNGFELCPIGADECIAYTDFKVDAAGKLTDLSVNGQPISSLLTVGNGSTVQAKGVKVQFLTAYRNKVGLWVIAKVTTSDKPVQLNHWSATYRDPAGKQRTATEAMGPDAIEAKSSSFVGMVFAGSKPGGKVTLDGSMDDFMTEWKTTFTVG